MAALNIAGAFAGALLTGAVAVDTPMPQFPLATMNALLDRSIDDAISATRLFTPGENSQLVGPGLGKRPNQPAHTHEHYVVGYNLYRVITPGVFGSGDASSWPTPNLINGTPAGDFQNVVTMSAASGIAQDDIVSSGYTPYGPVVTAVSGLSVTLSKECNAFINGPGDGHYEVPFHWMTPTQARFTDGTVVLEWYGNAETMLTSLDADGGWDAREDNNSVPPKWSNEFRVPCGTNADDRNGSYYDAPMLFEFLLRHWDRNPTWPVPARFGFASIADFLGFLRRGLTQSVQAMMTMDPGRRSQGPWNYSEWLLAEAQRPGGDSHGPVIGLADVAAWVDDRMAFSSESEFNGSWQSVENGWNAQTARNDMPYPREVGLLLGAIGTRIKAVGPTDITVNGRTGNRGLWLTQWLRDLFWRFTDQASDHDPANNGTGGGIGQDVQLFYAGLMSWGFSQWVEAELAAGRDPNRYCTDLQYDISAEFTLKAPLGKSLSQQQVDMAYEALTQWRDHDGDSYFIANGGIDLEDPSTYGNATIWGSRINAWNQDNDWHHPILNGVNAQVFVTAAIELAAGRAVPPAPGWDAARFMAIADRFIQSSLEEEDIDTLDDSGTSLTAYRKHSKQNKQLTVWPLRAVERALINIPERLEAA